MRTSELYLPSYSFSRTAQLAKVDNKRKMSPHFFYIALSLTALIYLCRAAANEGNIQSTDRPPYREYAKRARYIVNRANWTALATFSYHDPVRGFPYARVESCVDGPLHKGTGTPYFYLMKEGTPMQNIDKHNNVTISYTEAEFSDIAECKISPSSDPQNPLCSRLMMYGSIYKVTDKDELEMAKGALFSRHPFMKDLPVGHQFRVYGLDIIHIYILDFFGGAVPVEVSDYYNA